MRTVPRLLCIWIVCVFLLTPSPGSGAGGEAEKDILPSIDEVTATMKKAGARFRRDASLFGGYPRGWTADRRKAITENKESPTIIEIQPSYRQKFLDLYTKIQRLIQ